MQMGLKDAEEIFQKKYAPFIMHFTQTLWIESQHRKIYPISGLPFLELTYQFMPKLLWDDQVLNEHSLGRHIFTHPKAILDIYHYRIWSEDGMSDLA